MQALYQLSYGPVYGDEILPRWMSLIHKSIAAKTGTLEVDREDSSIQLAGALRAADDTFHLGETEDRDVPHRLAGEWCHAVQRVATFEDLQVAGLEVKRVDEGLRSEEHTSELQSH